MSSNTINVSHRVLIQVGWMQCVVFVCLQRLPWVSARRRKIGVDSSTLWQWWSKNTSSQSDCIGPFTVAKRSEVHTLFCCSYQGPWARTLFWAWAFASLFLCLPCPVNAEPLRRANPNNCPSKIFRKSKKREGVGHSFIVPYIEEEEKFYLDLNWNCRNIIMVWQLGRTSVQHFCIT
jgi:hypothetical protein